jgi:hypothetical protein
VLDRLLPTEPGVTLATVVESTQPISTMLYATRGMTPRVPWFDLDGPLDVEALGALPAGIAAGPFTEADVSAVDELDRSMLGYARPQDHRWLIATAELARVYRDPAGAAIGYGYVLDDEWVAPILARDEPTTLAILGDVIAAAAPSGTYTVNVLGGSSTILQGVLRAGGRCTSPRPFIYSSNGPVMPPSYIPHTGYLP